MASKNPVVLLASVLLLASFGLPAASIDSSNTTSEVVPHAHMGRELQQIETAAAVAGIVASAVTVASTVFGGSRWGGIQIKSAAAELPTVSPFINDGCRRPQVSQCLDGIFEGYDVFSSAPCEEAREKRQDIRDIAFNADTLSTGLGTKECFDEKGAQNFKDIGKVTL